MTYQEAFDALRPAFKAARAKSIAGHLALQINLTDEDAHGVFYVEVTDGKLAVEPYDYRDRDAMLLVNSADLLAILTAKLSLEKALADDRLVIEGDVTRAMELARFVVKPAAKKPAAKKPAAKAPAAAKKPAAGKKPEAAEKAPAAAPEKAPAKKA